MTEDIRRTPRRWYRGAILALATLAILASAFIAPRTAQAITRTEIVKRAQQWVKTGVSYSQSRYHDGYRTDCSGFVSMAWRLDESYTTRTISSQAKRVSLKNLEPGDAILTPGHIVIFAGWANKQHTKFISLEEANSRIDTVRRIKALPGNGRGLRFKGISQPAPKPGPEETATVAEVTSFATAILPPPVIPPTSDAPVPVPPARSPARAETVDPVLG